MRFLQTVFRNRSLARAADALDDGRLEEAFSALEPFLRGASVPVEALQVLGGIRLAQGAADDAREAFQRVLAESPNDPTATEGLRQVHIQKAFAAREEEDHALAADELCAALELNPSDAFVHYNLGNVYADMGDRAEDALRCWRAAVELRQDYVEAHFDLGQVLFYNGRYDEAMPHFEAILRARTDWPAPFYCLAAIHARQGNREAAMENLTTALLLNSGWARTATDDPHLASLRGDPEFDRLVADGATVPVDDLRVLTREDLLRDMAEDSDDGDTTD